MSKSKAKKIEEVLNTGVEKVLPDKESLKRLIKKQKITLYLGIDPTSPKIHLGHTVPLRKLRQFQKLGHKVILLFGTFTAQIGDPSGRDKKRKVLEPKQIKKNIATYKKQASKIIDFSKAEIKYNADWLSKLKFKDLLGLASRFTTSRLLERDMFAERLKRGAEVWLSELLYPLMQGYDSVAMDVDLEIGGTDQTFNMLVGRKLQKIYNKKEKFILTVPLLIGLDGRKMSKSYSNVVNLTDTADEMYGKIMSLKDDLVFHYFELCLGTPLSEIKKMKGKKTKIRDVKAKLAKEIVDVYHGAELAGKAEKEFNKVFRDKKLPSKIEKFRVKEKKINILNLLLKTKKVKSKSEAKRLVLQKAIKIDDVVKKDWKEVIEIKKGSVIKIGKRKFIRII